MTKNLQLTKNIILLWFVYNIMCAVILFNIFKMITFIKNIFKYQFDIILLGIIIEL
jgi:hypothetical protein